MRSRTAQWFECKIKYEKVMDDGLQKQVVEQYVVDALSFAEAEQRITEQFCCKREQYQARLSNAECSSKSTEGQMSAYISGEFEVADVKKAAYKEVFFDDDNAASDRWYKAKLDFITIDEKTEKEKRSRVTYLVQATNLNRAMKNVDTVMGGTMIDYDAASISDTKLVDVFETMEQREQKVYLGGTKWKANGARSSYAESRQSSTEGQYSKGNEAEE